MKTNNQTAENARKLLKSIYLQIAIRAQMSFIEFDGE